MPLLSAFTPFGLLEFSSEPSIAERIHESMWANLNGGRENFARDDGGHMGGKIYADAMGLAWAMQAARRTQASIDPAQAHDLLPALEAAYGLVVSETATLSERRTALALAERAGQLGNAANISQALADLLGADFVQYRNSTYAESSVFPSNPAVGPGLFGASSMARVLGKTTTGLSVDLDGTALTVGYTNIDGQVVADADRVQTGMRLVVEADRPDLAERVLVQAASTSGVATFTAAFTKPHPEGAVIVAMPWPYWFSTKRHSLIQVTATAAADPEIRRKVHSLMRRMARGVSTWAICGNAGPFTLDSATLGILDATPLGSL